MRRRRSGSRLVAIGEAAALALASAAAAVALSRDQSPTTAADDD